MDLKLKEKIDNFINGLGSFEFGYIECRKFYELKEYFEDKISKNFITEFEDRDVEKRINPFNYFEDGKTIVSIAFPYLTTKNITNESFSKYITENDYHYVVNNYLHKICKFIKSLGYEAFCFTDSNNLPERYIAYLAGIGHIGRNSLLYTAKYGSYVFLGEIITNADISFKYDDLYYKEKFSKIEEYKKCGKCTKCLSECPNNVLVNKNFSSCVSCLTQKKHLSDYEIDKLNNMIFGCDICQDSCPKNKSVHLSDDRSFFSSIFLKEVDDRQIIEMDNKFFKENFKKLSCSWRGKNILKRNALIKHRSNKTYINTVDFDNSEYLNYYKNKLLDK